MIFGADGFVEHRDMTAMRPTRTNSCFSWLHVWVSMSLLGISYAFLHAPCVRVQSRSLSPKVTVVASALDAYSHFNEQIASLEVATIDVNIVEIFRTAVDKGKSGASAASVQVLTLMWLRTTLNYQYRFGMDTKTALNTLWNEGGIPRLYQGLPFAMVQGPLSRFGDTAANALILAYLDTIDPTGSIPIFVRTAAGSVSAGVWRVIILPIDTMKTIMQVNGKEGFNILREKLKNEGPAALYNGATASVLATIVGHYPWFATYNLLSEYIPTAHEIQEHIATSDLTSTIDASYALLGSLDQRLFSLLRSGVIGVAASSTSDICSNGLRVLKTLKQTSSDNATLSTSKFSYIGAARHIINSEGWYGLLGRGLETRLLANAVQGALFSVLFKLFQDSSR